MTPPNKSSKHLNAATAPFNAAITDENSALRRACQSPLSWETLQSIVLSSDLVKLARSEEQQRVYRKSRAQMHDNWESIYDYLLCVKFGFEEGISEASGKKRSIPAFEVLRLQWRSMQLSTTAGNSYRMVLCLNDYPYYLGPGIEHWILWKLGGQDVEEREIQRAKFKILCQCTGVVCDDDGIEMQSLDLHSSAMAPKGECDLSMLVNDDLIFLHWVNPPHLKRQVV